ncbi:MAG: hypothetical protein Q7T10_16105 [Rhodoferax sp.]|uniref:hypothetical protein n=1 Tax=Rhodoferax sp. TaxID=50421 RepID=UPI00271CDCAB|nr:hypothetical protein [Rhodoferax sp.]MDO8450322.1 hypothetical protein [Rhodoferax sp.]
MAQDDAMSEFHLNGGAESGFSRAMDHVKAWCAQHQWQVGVAEMALGAGIVAAGLKTGAIQMGVDVALSAGSPASLFGGMTGAGLGALPGYLLGNIGVVAMGSAVAVPAVALMGGGALILGLAGYGVGGLIQKYLHSAPDLLDLAGSSALVLVGVALLVDGARRVVKDPDVTALMAAFKNNVLALHQLTPARVIDSLSGLSAYFEAEVLPFLREVATNPKSAAATAALAALGAAGGSAVAVSSVTLLGSSSLGALGLSLGIVSAPVWPVVAGGGLAVAAAYGVWRYMRRSGPTLVAIAGNGLSPPVLPAPKPK